MANNLPRDKQIAVISALVEGSSIRATERMLGIHRDTIQEKVVSSFENRICLIGTSKLRSVD
jgi:transposase